MNGLSNYLKEKYTRETQKNTQLFLGFNLTRLQKVAYHLDGIQPGLYIIGAETNIGKTAFLTTILLDLLHTSLDPHCIYISLDDTKDVIINRLISQHTGIEINKIQKPHLLSETQLGILENYGYGRLIEWAQSGRCEIIDMNSITSFGDIEKIIEARNVQIL